MYDLQDKPAAIREVQRYLNLISDNSENKIPRIGIDGIYGDETRGAVSKFQELYKLQISGIVDLLTFTAIYEEYERILDESNRREYLITDIGFPITLGMQGKDVLYINLLLKELSNTYRDIGYIEESKYYWMIDYNNKTVKLNKFSSWQSSFNP